LVLDTSEKIRLAGINSPELARENPPAAKLNRRGWTSIKWVQAVRFVL